MKKLKVLELFGGIGACSKALERLGIDYEIADYVEIDKYAVKSFNAIHNTNFEPQDITQWDKDIEVDLVMHGSPCQDFSLAGLQAGGDEGSGTRSSLMYETIRIVKKLKPKYVVWENVKNVISKKHKHNFDNYVNRMSELGYMSYYQVLNAKDYGIPQNRERVFTISIRNDDLIVRGSLQKHASIRNDGICPTSTSAMGMGGGQVPIIYKKSVNFEFPNGNKNDNQIKKLFNFSARQDCRVVYDQNGLCPTLVAGMGEGGGKVPMFIENGFEFPPKQELKLKLKDMLEDEVDEKYYLSDEIISKIKHSNFMQEKKRIQEKEYCDTLLARDWKDPKCVEVKRKYGVFDTEQSTHQAGSVYDENGLSPTLDTMQGGWRQPCIEDTSNLRIRKLTPKECWRLMGFDDEDFKKAEKVNSNTQLYKQAGNSIVVNVLEAIFKNLLQDYIDDWDLSDLD